MATPFNFRVRFSPPLGTDRYLTVDRSRSNFRTGLFGETCIGPKDDPAGTIWRVSALTAGIPYFMRSPFTLTHMATQGHLYWRPSGETAIVATPAYGSRFASEEALMKFDRITHYDIGRGSPTVWNPGVAINNHDKSHVLDVDRGRSDAGTPVIAFPWNGGPNQVWWVEALDHPPADFHSNPSSSAQI